MVWSLADGGGGVVVLTDCGGVVVVRWCGPWLTVGVVLWWGWWCCGPDWLWGWCGGGGVGEGERGGELSEMILRKRELCMLLWDESQQ